MNNDKPVFPDLTGPVAALTTLNASWWELRKARWFGDKCIVEDELHRTTAYRYKGKLYFWEYEEVSP